MVRIEQYDALLTFDVVKRAPAECNFLARYRGGGFEGEVPSSDFHVGSPASLFRQMASAWQGWEGALQWQDLEGGLELSATSDVTGHVILGITMQRYTFRPDVTRRLAVVMVIDAGTLDRIASDMEALFA